MVTAQQTRGLFLPYPLLAILTTVGALVLSGIVGLYVQVSSLQTTLLLREQDRVQQVRDLQAQMAEIKDKNEQLQVYITNDREKLVAIETKLGIRR